MQSSALRGPRSIRVRTVPWLASTAGSALLIAGVALFANRARTSLSGDVNQPSGAAAPAVPLLDPPRGCASEPPAPMLRIPEGSYLPFYKTKTPPKRVDVPAFYLDAAPVTRAEFRGFVCENPKWRKSALKPLFAEKTYLSDWNGDLDGGESNGDDPATFVSWFAAKAYCESRGKRLPSLIEWERVAGAPGGADAKAAPPARPAAPPFRFAMGRVAGDLVNTELAFAGVWEWVMDFNSVEVTGRPEGSDGPATSLFCGDGFRATDATNYGAFLRYSFRSSLKANYALRNLGFRCAKSGS
jgi:formylglycine-generating enzyme